MAKRDIQDQGRHAGLPKVVGTPVGNLAFFRTFDEMVKEHTTLVLPSFGLSVCNGSPHRKCGRSEIRQIKYGYTVGSQRNKVCALSRSRRQRSLLYGGK